MPNPPGPDHDEGHESDPGNHRSAMDADPVTEVIEIGDIAGPADDATGERRYTAPGFDAGSTQIISRVPDAETEFIATRTAEPQAIAPRMPTRRPSQWLIPVILFIAALVTALVLGVILVRNAGSSKVSQEDMVRSAIQTFDTAVQKGDLATLRSVTCGQTRDSYVNYDDRAWADTYARVAAAKQYPVVASIDEVIVNGEHAEANVTSYMAFDPDTASTRSFDLQFRDEQWKICQSS